MQIQIQSVHFDAAEALQEFTQKRLEKLETFYDKIIDAEVTFRLDKGEHSRENKAVDIKLNIPGHQLVAKSIDTSFEAAVDDATEALRRQIKKHKEKAKV